MRTAVISGLLIWDIIIWGYVIIMVVNELGGIIH